jgi:tetratricopeptide (TPR) repeat protein
MAYAQRGWTYKFAHKFDEALTDYNKAIEISPEETDTYLHRGKLFALMNNPENAKKDYETVILQDSVIHHGGNCRQYALWYLGKKDEAIEWQNKILEKYPTEGNYYDASCLYSLMEEKEQALKYLELAFKNGYRDFHHIQVDDDMDNIRELPEFKSLVKKYESLK